MTAANPPVPAGFSSNHSLQLTELVRKNADSNLVRLANSTKPTLPTRGGGAAWYGHVKGVQQQQQQRWHNQTRHHHDAAAATQPTARVGGGIARGLSVGTHAAARLRRLIFTRLGLTSCGGIGHNKAVAKVAGELNKPNQQTCVLPWIATKVLDDHGMKRVPGIGRAARKKLEAVGITTLQSIRDAPAPHLAAILGSREARTVAALARAIDPSAVVMSGKPKSLSNEDNVGRCTDMTSVVVRLEPLVRLLLSRVDADHRMHNRYPATLRLSICGQRYRDRRSRQCSIGAAVFEMADRDDRLQRVVDMCIQLLRKLVGKGAFVVSVINVAVTNFHTPGAQPLAPFLGKLSATATSSSNGSNGSSNGSSSRRTSTPLGCEQPCKLAKTESPDSICPCPVAEDKAPPPPHPGSAFKVDALRKVDSGKRRGKVGEHDPGVRDQNATGSACKQLGVAVASRQEEGEEKEDEERGEEEEGEEERREEEEGEEEEGEEGEEGEDAAMFFVAAHNDEDQHERGNEASVFNGDFDDDDAGGVGGGGGGHAANVWTDDEQPPAFACPVCNAVLPLFVQEAHEQFHALLQQSQ